MTAPPRAGRSCPQCRTYTDRRHCKNDKNVQCDWLICVVCQIAFVRSTGRRITWPVPGKASS